MSDADMLRRVTPRSFSDLRNQLLDVRLGLNQQFDAALFHRLAESLDLWASPDEVSAFANGAAQHCHDSRRLFLQELTLCTIDITCTTGKLFSEAKEASMLTCPGCVRVFDGGDCALDDTMTMSVYNGPPVKLGNLVHATILCMTVAVSVLHWQTAQGLSSARFLEM